ncbi:probable DNA double-strand break repair Rad50 ATPase [Rhodamnia argentea]|uniref:FRIGIDA-like protein n=1 Tax=Rhodamnia argentea TaxID=178133 RepID=A0A8B8NDQ1_9MYRT|nr:probable DNA double-strand break repair Rad50 ATPase [Rhodamnia argentea]XP_030520586.1 probable DNA double-strand break repair Rad50 ATPase [Rhodamnia argentea]XP_048137430.1 probable DNA double-strand break repair Rad50 ATPase [Rhodamnia argentea]
MEKISGELTRAELQKETLFKAYEQLHSQASSVLSFSLQWKDLEERFDGIRRSLERRAEELDERERSLAEGAARDVASREEGLRSAWRTVEEWEDHVRRKKMDLRFVEERLEKSKDEHREVECQLVVKRDCLRECISLVRDKKNQLSTLKEKTEKCHRDYDSKKVEVEVLRQELDSTEKKVGEVRSLLEENARELHVKAVELGSAKRSLEECSRAVESKESHLRSVNILIEKHKEDLKSKKTELEGINRLINERLTELALKDRELGSIESSIGRQSEELKSKEGELENMMKRVKQCKEETQSKKEDLASVQAKLEEVAKSLELESREFNTDQASIKDRNLELASKKSQLESIEVNIAQCAEQLRLKEQEYASIQTSTLECAKVLESQKKSLESCSREMELREWIRVDSGVMAQNWKCPLASAPVLASSPNSQPTFSFNGKNLQMVIYGHFQELSGVCHKVLELIQKSANAAKLVLGAMEGFYPQDSGNKDELLDIGVIRRSCIFLLENLIRSSAQIKPQQREAAMTLAVEWKGKLKFSPSPVDPLEVLGFLKLLEAYKLASAFDANEIHELADSVSQLQIAQGWQLVLGSSALRSVKRRCS